MSNSRKLIYFCGSKFGGRQDEVLYNILFDKLEKYGEVIKPFDPEKGINQLGSRSDNRLSMHDRDVELLNMCDVLVAEVTHPSLGVGYEIGRGVEMGKPVLCLYRPQPRKKLSGMLRGMDNNDYLRICDYSTPSEVDKIFEDFLPKYSNFKLSKEELVGCIDHSQPQVNNLAHSIPGLGGENLKKSQLENKKRREALKNEANSGGDEEQNRNDVPTTSIENNGYQGANSNVACQRRIRQLEN